MTDMIAAYFGKGVGRHEEFDTLNVAKYPWYKKHLNKHNVIHIVLNEIPKNWKAYPDAEIEAEDAVWDSLKKVYAYCNGEKFIFILDEWDYIYHQDFAIDRDKESFTKFLSNLLKDKAYVELAYMTGILPIAKYSSGSELNMPH